MHKKIDSMLLATFLTTIFYSATYPFIHKLIMESVSDNIVALNQIINCISIVLLGSLWNKKSDKLFNYYPLFCIGETILGICSTVWATTTNNIMAYYLIDTMIFAVITRNICCGGVKLRAIRYRTEKDRERFDNNNNSASAIATIIGSIIAMVLDLDFSIMLWIATFGNAIDNIFYIFIFKEVNMKQPKKLIRSQKEILKKNGLNWNDFMLLTEDKDTFTVIAKNENEYGHKEQYTYTK